MNEISSVDWPALAQGLGLGVSLFLGLMALFLAMMTLLLPITVYVMMRDVRRMRLMMEKHLEAERYRSRELTVKTIPRH